VRDAPRFLILLVPVLLLAGCASPPAADCTDVMVRANVEDAWDFDRAAAERAFNATDLAANWTGFSYLVTFGPSWNATARDHEAIVGPIADGDATAIQVNRVRGLLPQYTPEVETQTEAAAATLAALRGALVAQGIPLDTERPVSTNYKQECD